MHHWKALTSLGNLWACIYVCCDAYHFIRKLEISIDVGIISTHGTPYPQIYRNCYPSQAKPLVLYSKTSPEHIILTWREYYDKMIRSYSNNVRNNMVIVTQNVMIISSCNQAWVNNSWFPRAPKAPFGQTLTEPWTDELWGGWGSEPWAEPFSVFWVSQAVKARPGPAWPIVWGRPIRKTPTGPSTN